MKPNIKPWLYGIGSVKPNIEPWLYGIGSVKPQKVGQ